MTIRYSYVGWKLSREKYTRNSCSNDKMLNQNIVCHNFNILVHKKSQILLPVTYKFHLMSPVKSIFSICRNTAARAGAQAPQDLHTHTHTTIYLLIIHKPFIVPTAFDHRSQHFSNFECFHILYLSCSAVWLTLTISSWSKQSHRCRILIYSCYLKCVIHQDKFSIS